MKAGRTGTAHCTPPRKKTPHTHSAGSRRDSSDRPEDGTPGRPPADVREHSGRTPMLVELNICYGGSAQ